MAQYCPHTETCPFYKNWVEQTKDRRADVITFKEEGYYDCLALIALDDPETGIPMGDGLKNRLSSPNDSRFDCSHLTQLNHSVDLENKLRELLENL